MNVKKLTATLLSVCMAFSFVACSNKTKNTDKKEESKIEEKKTPEIKKKDGGTLVFAASSEPLNFTPFFAQDRVTHSVCNAIFDPLYIYDGKETRYYLAENMKISDDALTYTIKLKNNLKWHDGKKITADDIIFSIESALDEKQNIRGKDTFTINKKPVKLTKKDDLTVDINLPEVYAPFKVSMSSFRPIPKHIFEGKGQIEKAEASTKKPIGSGAYKFKEWKKGETLSLERVTDYYGGKPNIEKVVFRVIEDDNSAITAFQNEEVTATYLSDENYLKFKENDKFNTFTFDEGMLRYLVFNMSSPNLKKKEVREAVSYALNKDELRKSDAGTTELNKPAYSIFAPTTLYHTNNVEKYDYNKDKAKELLKKAGIKDLKLKFVYDAGKDSEKKMAQIVQQQLKDIGIKVELVSSDFQAITDMLLGKKPRDYDLVVNGYIMKLEPSAYSELYSTKATFNPSDYKNPELDKLWDKAAIEKDNDKRKEMYEEIQKIVAKDIAIYPVFYGIAKVGTAKNLGGVEEAKLVPIYMFENLSKLYFTE